LVSDCLRAAGTVLRGAHRWGDAFAKKYQPGSGRGVPRDEVGTVQLQGSNLHLVRVLVWLWADGVGVPAVLRHCGVAVGQGASGELAIGVDDRLGAGGEPGLHRRSELGLFLCRPGAGGHRGRATAWRRRVPQGDACRSSASALTRLGARRCQPLSRIAYVRPNVIQRSRLVSYRVPRFFGDEARRSSRDVPVVIGEVMKARFRDRTAWCASASIEGDDEVELAAAG